MSKEAISNTLIDTYLPVPNFRWDGACRRWEAKWEVPVEVLLKECDRMKAALLELHKAGLLELEDQKIFHTQSKGRGFVIAYLSL